MKIHIVKAGDTLYELAKKYNVTLEKLIELNPHIADPDKIDVGMKVKIPSLFKPVAAPVGEYVHKHIVQMGDTLWKLAKQWKVPFQALLKANPHLKNPNVLLTGDVVYIPKVGAETDAGIVPAPSAETQTIPINPALATEGFFQVSDMDYHTDEILTHPFAQMDVPAVEAMNLPDDSDIQAHLSSSVSFVQTGPQPWQASGAMPWMPSIPADQPWASPISIDQPWQAQTMAQPWAWPMTPYTCAEAPQGAMQIPGIPSFGQPAPTEAPVPFQADQFPAPAMGMQPAVPLPSITPSPGTMVPPYVPQQPWYSFPGQPVYGMPEYPMTGPYFGGMHPGAGLPGAYPYTGPVQPYGYPGYTVPRDPVQWGAINGKSDDCGCGETRETSSKQENNQANISKADASVGSAAAKNTRRAKGKARNKTDKGKAAVKTVFQPKRMNSH